MEAIGKKLDKIYFGFILGVIGPFIGFWVFYLLKFKSRTASAYIEIFLNVKEFQSPIASVSLIFNAFIFFLLLRFDYLKAGRGVLLATLLYAPVILYLYFR